MEEKYYIGKEHWGSVLKTWLEKFTVIAPQKEKGGLLLQPVTDENISSIVYDEARAAQPLKSYFIPPLEEVVGDKIKQEKPWLFLGIKACGLAALPILDQAFGGDFADPKFQERRESSLVVSSDCSQPLESCFCTLVGGQPYPVKGFDLNLSKVWDGFVIEVGSLRGKELLEGHDEAIKEVVKEEAETLEKMRKETVEKVKKQNQEFQFTGEHKEVVSANWESDVWEKHSEPCVECGACNHACPTCHCYFLDDVTRKQFVRLRGWDSCQYTGYAVTAGGGTPRPRLFERFRNRYFCKFKYLDDNFGMYGCTGCGRCIEGCQGKIDMRAAVRDLAKT
jgi:formate hydrogenlyase subunit 6/NADH:ubiquinone oxidoreductase subunit I